MTTKPRWYGRRYPTLEDLADFGSRMGAVVALDAGLRNSLCVVEDPPILLIATRRGPLDTAWALAHELAHLCLHAGPGSAAIRSKNERQANHWAACALIPQARVDFHQNASEDNFMAALSCHYEDLPPRDCWARDLAHEIARHRLDALLAMGGG